jgi:hypothetical protein
VASNRYANISILSATVHSFHRISIVRDLSHDIWIKETQQLEKGMNAKRLTSPTQPQIPQCHYGEVDEIPKQGVVSDHPPSHEAIEKSCFVRNA